ncbi:MAG: SEL1-like repeat protein [Bacteroidales bacterium]|nr:SEL1-like repeat protein [Bacteroidales bacterium]
MTELEYNKLIDNASNEEVLTLNYWGWSFYTGTNGCEQDYDKAYRLFSLAAERDCNYSIANLGNCYHTGHGTDKDIDKAIGLYISAASKGLMNDILCTWLVDACLEKHKLGEQESLLKLAEMGSNLLDGKNGCVADAKHAIQCLEAAANEDSPEAQNALGNCYYKGNGVEQDYVKALEWYGKAAEHGQVRAQMHIGYCYGHGQGVEQDYAKAVEWYVKAAEQDDASAQYYLAYSYGHGYGVEKDENKAFEWYSKAANQGLAIAQYELGHCYEHGKGVEQNYAKAVEWYTKAAEQGNSDALSLEYSNDCMSLPMSQNPF